MFHENPAKGRHWCLLYAFRRRQTESPIVHVHHQNHHHSDESQQFHIRLTFHRLFCFRMNQHHLIFGMQKYRTISNYQNFETSNIVLNPHCCCVDCFSKNACHVDKRAPSAFPKKVIYWSPQSFFVWFILFFLIILYFCKCLRLFIQKLSKPPPAPPRGREVKNEKYLPDGKPKTWDLWLETFDPWSEGYEWEKANTIFQI